MGNAMVKDKAKNQVDEPAIPDDEPIEGEPEATVPSPDEIDTMNEAINYWHMRGYPEKARVLEVCLEQNRRPPANLVYFGEVKPETAINPEYLQIPERTGPGATVKAWREFAIATSDMEPEIVNKMQRKDVIGALEVKGIIPREVPSGFAEKKR